ncbi:hypothetical protein VT06_03520 [Arsukibacterium sp. MJ3]|uniref:FimV/HubP family polar landmark protein n=1 Tax=Arsukibacterium sp. MJ3 TaxID=1632859 RepID=UPI000627010B|nr:FimV/HubP family polar landmark protein [Arsukibacterium sp. MJ3]KKO50063.1 hypothetical protein VT06_03520 [Arsukibacterium sp. MJ3]
MSLRLLSFLLIVNFSTLLAGVALAAEPSSTQLRGPKSSDTSLMQRQLGPLSSTDTLWRIAEQVKPEGATVSTYQVMYAIYLKNPTAFIDNNLNHLRPGATLLLPDLREIRGIDINVARAKSDSDDRAWAARTKPASSASAESGNTKTAPKVAPVTPAQLQQLTELKDQFGNSLLMIEAIARENNALKATLSQVQTDLLALQQQLGEDSILQQQLTTLLQQQADILAAQQAQEQQAAAAAALLAAEQESGSGMFNNPITWILAASIPALLILFGLVLWLKRRGQQTEAAVLAANSDAVPPANYTSPLPPLDESNDLDDSGLFDIDESLLDDAFSDNGDFASNNMLDDSLSDFGDDDLLADDILLDDDSLLAKNAAATSLEDDLLADALDVPDLSDNAGQAEFDANNILSDSDLNALLAAEDDDDTIIEFGEDQADEDTVVEEAFTVDLDDGSDELLEEIELDIPDELSDNGTVVATEQATAHDISEDEHFLVETADDSDILSNDVVSETLTDSQISGLVDDESFDRTELDAFAEALALENGEQNTALKSVDSETDTDELASELLTAELDELLQQVDNETVDNGDVDDEIVDDSGDVANSDGPDLQSSEDDSVTKPSEAALSVENPSKMLESYPELELNDDNINDEDQNLATLEDSQFDSLLTELEAMAQTTASDSEALSLDVDSVFTPALVDTEIATLSDDDFVEIDNLLANSEQLQEDDGRFEQLNVDVGLDEFADVISNDNPQDVDAEDNGFAAKLDLVRAYIEIDDKDSAEHIIADILDSDAPEHVKTEAQTLQKTLD